jgi:K+-transporting ATPase ATPase A chain
VSSYGFFHVALYVVVLLAVAAPLGLSIARALTGRRTLAGMVLGGVERGTYRLCRIDPRQEMSWRTYAAAIMAFNAVGFVVVYVLQRTQAWLPLNPQGLPGLTPNLSFNTAVSFATNTNWQAYSGEAVLSYCTQMLGLAVQNFLSAATGIAALAALARAFVRQKSATIGNAWVDITRSTLYVLLPLSFVLAVVLVSQGVVQSFAPYRTVPLLEATQDAAGAPVTEQLIPLGPAASQVAIKQLGTNGGGFFGVNSAHPFENPTPLSNLLEALSILLIGAALCFTFGRLVNDWRQGWALLAVMLIILVPLMCLCVGAEERAPPTIAQAGVDVEAHVPEMAEPGSETVPAMPGGNMEGKETRFGTADSAVWAATTTAASNGSVNAMHDSFTPLGGLVPLILMQLGEVVVGGVGSGLYGLLMFAIVAVFIAGLMVGRTPEYLGKKIEAFEMKMASVAILVPCLVVLAGTAIAVGSAAGRAGILNPGPHGFSEILYAFSSAGNNNGSAFAGLTVNTPFYNTLLGLAMLFARYWVLIPALAVAGSLAAKGITPATSGTLPTHRPLFVVMLTAVVLIVGALTFFPALALGPVVEHLRMLSP